MRRVQHLWLLIVRRCRSDRFFLIKPPFRGPGWYFDVRGAEPWGPYATADDARLVAGRFAETCQTRNDTGGRNDLLPSDSALSLSGSPT